MTLYTRDVLLSSLFGKQLRGITKSSSKDTEGRVERIEETEEEDKGNEKKANGGDRNCVYR